MRQNKPIDSSQKPAAKNQARPWVLVILVILSLYFPIKFPIPDTELFIPNIFGCMLGLYALYYMRGFLPSYFLVIGYLVLYLVPNIFFTSHYATTYLEKTRSAMLLIFNVSLFYLFCRSAFLGIIKTHKATYAFLAFSIAILIYAFLETKSAYFKQLSDSFRIFAYPANLIYIDDVRDVALSGGIRPKVFASEPAHVAFVVCSLLLLFVATRPKPWSFVVSSLLYAITALIVGSPFPFLFFPALYLIFLLASGKGLNANYIGLGASVITISVFLFWIFNAGYMEERYRIAIEGRDESATARVWRQFEYAQEGLSRNIYLGIGLGSEAELGDLLPHIPGTDRRDNMSIQSPLFAAILFGGILGLVLFVGFIWIAMQLPPSQKILGIGVFIILFFQGGNISSCMGWQIGGLLLAILNTPRSVRRSVSPLTELLGNMDRKRNQNTAL